jgi:cysteine desulfurase
MNLVTMPVDENGLLQLDSLNELPWGELRLVAVILAHNETGIIQRLERLSDLCEQHRVPLLVDAVQAVGKIPVDFRAFRATALAFGAHKFHGPRGVGGLLLRRGIRLASLLHGGHQESGRRAGTEPVPLISGMAESLRIFQLNSTDGINAIRQMRDELQRRLEKDCAPVIIHGKAVDRLPNTLSVAFPGLEGEAMLVNFDMEGIACSLGSTCASGSAEPAPALMAMGIPDDVCMASVRFSLSCLTTQNEVRLAGDRISSVVNRMRSAAS